MNSDTIEEVMSGTPDNDYPSGDYVCLCYGCGAAYHGPPTIFCYICSQNYEIETTSFVVRPSILIIGYVAIMMATMIYGISLL